MRGASEIGFEDALEFQERFVVECDAIEAGGFDTTFLQTKINGVLWEREVMLLARKTLLLRRRDDPPVPDETRRTIMIKC